MVDGEIFKMIRRTKELLEDKNIIFWLDEGTLLGTVRNGDTIAGDGDIDFSVWHDSLDQVLDVCEELDSNGYNIKYQKQLPYIEDLVQIYTSQDKDMNKMHIDLNIYTIIKNEAIRRDLHYPYGKIGKYLIHVTKILFVKEPVNRNSTAFLNRILPYRFRISLSYITMAFYMTFCKSIWQVVPKYMFEKLTDMQFLGMDFKVPEKYEEYLKYRYGKNWRVPNTNWNWRESGDMAIRYKKLNAVKMGYKKLKPYM